MNPLDNYIRDLVAQGDKLLSEYCSFLEIFKVNLKRNDILNDYLKLNLNWQNKIYKNYRVLNQMNNHQEYGYNAVLIKNCQNLIDNIRQTLDNDMSQLQDDICSLNKKNSLFGLKYNRYQTKYGLTPQYIDIKS
jgi:hypothetical protein